MQKLPSPTPPQDVAAAQTGTNINTAIANAYLQNPSEITPYGQTTVREIGMHQYTDPVSGETYDLPQFQRETTLSPMQQAISDQGQMANFNLAALGNTLSGQLGQQLTGPFQIDTAETEGRLMDLAREQYDPIFAEQEEALRGRLAMQGVSEGSDRYREQLADLNDARGRTYNDLMLRGRGQAVQEQIAADNQRINQIGALLSGGQVTQPQFMGAAMPALPTTDVAQIYGQSDAMRMARAHSQNAMYSDALGGLFGMGSKLALAGMA